ncbi:DUF1624 domain-containing protein [Candidatus Dojkabacteria bacterium]|uniref:DUF1624 domain-containing protein n=1 Tax=Candidatus Dojkabacteria bacterium TaxID=2099670 RepID=A0A3M0YY94_9BACT|nr:MAG: DUF1624 domain-containing protein [Candidatus Dojkabacteria bacterium]
MSYLIGDISTVKRFKILDVLRGFAVLSMIFAHVVAFFWRGNNEGFGSVINRIGDFGGIISFTLFLFLSGAAVQISFLDRYQTAVSSEAKLFLRKKFFLRCVKIIIIYFLIAPVSIFVTSTYLSLPVSIEWLVVALRILFFGVIPGFVEFLIAFFIFQLSVVLFPRLFQRISASITLIFLTGSIFWLLGTLFSQVSTGNVYLDGLKSVFAGHHSTINGNTFPVFQYLIIFLLGLGFGRLIQKTLFRFIKFKVVFVTFLVLLSATVSIYLLDQVFSVSLFKMSQMEGRFPPQLGFLVFSSFLVATVFLVYICTEKYTPALLKILLYKIGKQSLGYFVIHTLCLFLFVLLQKSGSPIIFVTTDDPFYLLLLYFLLVCITAFLVSLKNFIKSKVLSDEESTLSSVVWFFNPSILRIVVILTSLSLIFVSSFSGNSNKVNANEYTIKKKLISESEWPVWWDNSYKGFYQLVAKSDLFPGVWSAISVPLNELRSQSLILKDDASDVILVRFNERLGNFEIFPAYYEARGNDLIIFFRNFEVISKADDKYFVYFGNEYPTKRLISNEKFLNEPRIDFDFQRKDKVVNNILSKINRKWHIKKLSRAFNRATLQFDVTVPQAYLSPNTTVVYTVEGTSLKGRMQKIAENSYKANVLVSDLEPGVYKISASILNFSDGIKIVKTHSIPFYVSYPLYVAWTMDWEGWDVSDDNLNEIASIANKYKIPITHFFNPRIYVKNQFTINPISEERAQYITRWVSDRKRLFLDEIGMHIHMWSDMVQEVGVTPRQQYIVGTYGVDVPTYVYTEDELVKIFEWGRSKLAENGLGVPISYRTGAWMSGVNVLKAAERSAFKIDSSGRTSGRVNPTFPNSTPVPWNLKSTTRPYRPNKDDINKWDKPLSERMNIWEFPNNGADSYWFSAEVLISRFNDNYPRKGEILYVPNVVNYLSHPHWFVSYDRWKIRKLFDYIGQFLLSEDLGPVVYETLERIYADWEKDKFYNGD